MSSQDISPPSKDKQIDPETDRSMWMNDAFDKNPEISVLREKMLPLASGHSFANARFTDTIQDVSVANRYEILNLIAQHLNSIGLNYTADILSKETGFEFFNPPSSDWETTDLRMITSLSLGLRDSAWDEITELNHKFVLEEHEEDYNASPYREDPSLIWEEYFNPDINTVFTPNKPRSFATLEASTLRRVVVLLTSSNKGYLSDEDLNNFFLSLHSVTSSEHFYDLIMYLFFLKGNNPKIESIKPKELELLRMNIINLIKKWLFFHGLFIGKKTLKSIEEFLKEITNTSEYGFLKKFTASILSVIPTLTYGQKQGSSSVKKSAPIIPNPTIILSLDLKFFDPEPMEVARQVTLLAHDVFCSIHSMEFINAFSKKNSSAFSTPTLNEFNFFNERITLHVLETLAYADDPEDAYRRAVEICQCLLEMRNFGTLSAFVSALGRADSQELCRISEDTKKTVANLYFNSENYEDKLLHAYSSWSTAIPNMKSEIRNQLGSIENEEMPQFINGLINWNRVRKLSERSSIMYRFQNTKYSFYPVSQIQKVITRGPQHDEREIEIKMDQRIKERNENRSNQ